MVSGDPGRLGTLVHLVTMETSRPAQERHTHLRSYRGNQIHMCVCVCVCVCCTFVDVPVVSGETRMMCVCVRVRVCVCVYYTAGLQPGDPLRGYRGNMNWWVC